MARRRKPQDPTFALIEQMVEKSGLNATTQEDVMEYSKMFMKAFLERSLKGEMNQFLKEEKSGAQTDLQEPPVEVKEPEAQPNNNSRNGFSKKTVSTQSGKVTIDMPRDRRGRFLPKIVPKHSRRFEGFDGQIISLYAKGMSTRDIQAHLYEIYGTEVSPDLISEVTNELIIEVNQWQNRPLEPMYPVVYFDAIRVKIRNAANLVIPKAMYIALGVRPDGIKEVLGLWIDETESATFWLSVFNELKGRGVQDILIAVTDGLVGLNQAFEAAFPRTTHQTCVVHLIRNSLVLASVKNRAALANALKPIYQATTAQAAEAALIEFEASEIGQRYPGVARIWRNAWDRVIPFYAFSPAIRKLLYTTNAIESLNRSIRKIIKTKGSFGNDDAARKLVWLTLRSITEKWKRPSTTWSAAMEEMSVMFGERFTKYLD
jgi:putative transposase